MVGNFSYYFTFYIICILYFLEIKIPNSDESFSEIVIENEHQMERIRSFCLQSLTYLVELYPTSLKTAIISIPKTIKDVFARGGIYCKTAVLLFFPKLYSNTKEKIIDVCIAVAKDLCIVFMNLNDMIQKKIVEESYISNVFYEAIKSFLDVMIAYIKTPNTNLPIYHLNEQLVSSLIHLVYYENLFNFDKNLPSMTFVFTRLLNCILESISDSNDILSPISILIADAEYNSRLLTIIKYQMVYEIINSNFYDCKLSQISITWKGLHSMLFKKLEYINSEITMNQFMENMVWIKHFMKMTIQIDYHFTRKHQLRHLKNISCDCNIKPKLKNENMLMEIDRYNYNHIHLEFFDDINIIIKSFIQTLKKRIIRATETLQIFVKIFTYLLMHLSFSSTKANEEDLIFMMAVITIPFYPAFVKSEISERNEFMRIKLNLTHNIKNFIMNLTNDEKNLDLLKRDSLKMLCYLNFSKISSFASWIAVHTIHITLTTEKSKNQAILLKNYKNLLINNHHDISTYLNIYQKNRLDRNSSLELNELKKINCLTNKDTLITKTASSNYIIYCSGCNHQNHRYMHDKSQSEVKKILTYLKVSRTCLISSKTQESSVQKLKIYPSIFMNQNTTFIERFIKSVPSCIIHSSNFVKTFNRGNNRLLDMILMEDEKVLVESDFYLESIVLCVINSDSTEDIKDEFFEKFLKRLFEMTLTCCRKSNYGKIQFHLSNIITSYGGTLMRFYSNNGIDDTSHVDEVALKCFKLLMYFAIMPESDVKGTSVANAVRMLEGAGITIDLFLNWYRKPFLEHVISLCLFASLSEDDERQTFFKIFENVSLLNQKIIIIF